MHKIELMIKLLLNKIFKLIKVKMIKVQKIKMILILIAKMINNSGKNNMMIIMIVLQILLIKFNISKDVYNKFNKNKMHSITK